MESFVDCAAIEVAYQYGMGNVNNALLEKYMQARKAFLERIRIKKEVKKIERYYDDDRTLAEKLEDERMEKVNMKAIKMRTAKWYSENYPTEASKVEKERQRIITTFTALEKKQEKKTKEIKSSFSKLSPDFDKYTGNDNDMAKIDLPAILELYTDKRNKNKQNKRKHPISLSAKKGLILRKQQMTARIDSRLKAKKEDYIRRMYASCYGRTTNIVLAMRVREIVNIYINNRKKGVWEKEDVFRRLRMDALIKNNASFKEMERMRDLMGLKKECDKETVEMEHESDDLKVNLDEAQGMSSGNSQMNVQIGSVAGPVKEKHVESVADFGVRNYYEKWHQVDTFSWSSNATFDGNAIYSLSIFEDLFLKLKKTTALLPFNNCQYFRTDVDIIITINTNQFTSGQLQVSFVYGVGRTATSDDALVSVYSLSQKDNVLVNAGGDQEVKLSIPFKYPLSMIKMTPITSQGLMSMGTMYVKVLSPLRHKGTQEFSTTCYVSAELKNSEFSGMIATDFKPLTEDELEHEMMPALINVAAKALIENCDDPPQKPTRPQLVPIAGTGMSHGTHSYPANEIMRLDPLGVTPHNYDVNDFNVNKILQTYGLFDKFSIKSDATVGKCVKKIEVGPMQEKTRYPKITGLISQDTKSVNIYALPPLAILSSMYGYFRGSIDYRFDVVATSFHACKLLVAFVPGPVKKYTSTWSVQDFRNCHHQVYDILKEKQFKFSVPYICDQMYYPRRSLTNIGMSDFLPYGHVYVVLMSKLYTSDMISDTIDVLMYVKAGDDFELAVPAQGNLMPSYDRGDIGLAKFNKITFLEGYFPAYQGTWHTFSNNTKYFPILRYGDVSDHICQLTHAHKYSVYKISNKIDTWKMYYMSGEAYVQKVIEYICPIYDGKYFYAVPFHSESEAKFFASLCSTKKAWGNMQAYAQTMGASLSFPSYIGVKESEYYDIKYGNLVFDFVISYLTSSYSMEDFDMCHEAGDQSIDNTVESDISKSVNDMSMLHFGERTMNLKDICRRDCLYASIQLDKNMPFLTTSINVPVLPWGVTLQNMSSNLTPVRSNLGLICSGFLFAKGTLRFRIIAQDDTKFWVQHRYDAFNVSEQSITFTDPNTSNLGLASGYSTAYQDSAVNSVMTLEIPYYSPCNRIYANPTGFAYKSGIFTDQMFNLGSLMIGSSKPSKFLIFYSFGDDFQLSDFNGFPPVIFNSDVMNTEPVVSLEHEMGLFDYLTSKPETPSAESTILAPEVPKTNEKKSFSSLNPLRGIQESKEKIDDAVDNVNEIANDVKKDMMPKVSGLCDSITSFLGTLNIKDTVKSFFCRSRDFMLCIISNILHVCVTRTIGHICIALVAILGMLGIFSGGFLDGITTHIKSIFHYIKYGLLGNVTGGPHYMYLPWNKDKYSQDIITHFESQIPSFDSVKHGRHVRFIVSKMDKVPVKITFEEFAQALETIPSTHIYHFYSWLGPVTGRVMHCNLVKAHPPLKDHVSITINMWREEYLTAKFRVHELRREANKEEDSELLAKVFPKFHEDLKNWAKYHTDVEPRCDDCEKNPLHYYSEDVPNPKSINWNEMQGEGFKHESPDDDTPSIFVDLISLLVTATSASVEISNSVTDGTKRSMATEFAKKLPQFSRNGLNISRFFRYIWEVIQKCFYIVKDKLFPEEKMTHELIEKFSDVREWVDEVNFLIHPDNFDKLKTSEALRMRVDLCLKTGTNLICLLDMTKKYSSDVRFVTLMQTCYNKILDLRQRCNDEKINIGSTYEPFTMYFHGNAGIGKSFFKDTLFTSLARNFKLKSSGLLYFPVPLNSEFWTGVSDEPICFVDDFNLTNGSEETKTYQNICQMKSSFAYKANGASIADKGKNYNPEFLVICSNKDRPKIEKIDDIDAFMRRPEIYCHMRVRPDLEKQGLSKFNQIKAKGLQGKTGMFEYLEFGIGRREEHLRIDQDTTINYDYYKFPDFMQFMLGCVTKYRMDELQNCERRFKTMIMTTADEEMQVRAKLFLRPDLAKLDYSSLKSAIEIEASRRVDDDSSAIEKAAEALTAISNVVTGQSAPEEDRASDADFVEYDPNYIPRKIGEREKVSVNSLPESGPSNKEKVESIANMMKELDENPNAQKEMHPDVYLIYYRELSSKREKMRNEIDMIETARKEYVTFMTESTGGDFSHITKTDFLRFLHTQLYREMILKSNERKENDNNIHSRILRQMAEEGDIAARELLKDKEEVERVVEECEEKENREKSAKAIFSHEAKLDHAELVRVISGEGSLASTLNHEEFLKTLKIINDNGKPNHFMKLYHIEKDFLYFTNDSETYLTYIIRIPNEAPVDPRNHLWKVLYEWNMGKLATHKLTVDTVPLIFKERFKAVTSGCSKLRLLFTDYCDSVRRGLETVWESTKSCFKSAFDYVVKYKWIFSIIALMLGAWGVFSLVPAVSTAVVAGSAALMGGVVNKCRNFFKGKEEKPSFVVHKTPTTNMSSNTAGSKKLDFKTGPDCKTYQCLPETWSPREMSTKNKNVVKHIKQSKNVYSVKMYPEVASNLDEDVVNRIVKNTFWFVIVDSEENVHFSARFFVIRSRQSLMPLHYIEAMSGYFSGERAKNDQFKLLIVRENLKIPVTWDSIRKFTSHAGSSLVSVELPAQFPCARTCDSMLLSKYDTSLDKMPIRGSYVVQPGPTALYIHSVNYKIGAAHVRKEGLSSEVYVDNGYLYGVHGKGMCGSVLVVNNKIVGMHVAGGDGQGLAEPLVDVVLSHESIINGDLPDIGINVNENLKTEGSCELIGKVAPLYASYCPSQSSIRKTGLYDIFQPRYAPAHLKPFESFGETVSPLFSGIEHHMKPVGVIDEKILYSAAAHYSRRILAKVRPMRARTGVLDVNDAIFGMGEINPYYKSIDSSTSVGWPLNRYVGMMTKNQCYGYEPGHLHKDFKDMLESYDTLRRQGLITFTVFDDKLKDDLIPIEKCNMPGSTRIISCSPLEFTVSMRRYFGDFINAMSSGCLESESAVGINVMSRDWHNLVMYMVDFSPFMVDGDYSKFGPRLSLQVIDVCIKIINDWYIKNGSVEKEDNVARTVMMYELMHSMHLAHSYLYRTVSGAPSGSPITVVLNGMVNSIYMRVCWIMQGNNIDDFGKNVRVMTYGDDLFLSLKENIIETFNFQTIQQSLKKLDIKFTNAKKNDEGKKVVLYDEISFLKSKIISQDDGRNFLYALEEDSIYKMVCFYSESSHESPKDLIITKIITAGCYAVAHGEEFYDNLYYECAKYLLERFEVSLLRLPYKDALRQLIHGKIDIDDVSHSPFRVEVV